MRIDWLVSIWYVLYIERLLMNLSESFINNLCQDSYVHSKTTYEWHTDDMRLHTSDIRMTCEYIRVTYGWHTSTYEWYKDDIRVHTSDIRMKYEWYTSTYDLDANLVRNIKLYNEFGASKWLFLTVCVKNTALCWCRRFLVTKLFLFS